MGKFVRLSLCTGACLLSFIVTHHRVGAATITFDEFSGITNIATQYQGMGVTAYDVTVMNSTLGGFPDSVSPPNIAYASTGTMTFDFYPAVAGNITTISLYVRSLRYPVTVAIYDANGNRTKKDALSSLHYTQLTLTSATPIARVEIIGRPSDFAIDNFTFSSTPPFALSGRSPP